MKKTIVCVIFVSIFVAIGISLIPPVFAPYHHQTQEPMSVSTDKSSYNYGELVTISGQGAQSYSISIQINSPTGEEVTKVNTFKSGAGEFSTTWIVPNGIELGTYTITASDTTQTAQTTITIETKNPPQATEAQEKQFTFTDIGTYEVSLKTNPTPPQTGEKIFMFLEVLTKPNRLAQLHVDYEVLILKGTEQILTTSLQHTDGGTTSVSYKFDSAGEYFVILYIEGILFSPIPTEIAGFKLAIGDTEQPNMGTELEEKDQMQTTRTKTNIPQWVKQVAEFWVADQIDDGAFVQVIEYLVQQEIIFIPYAEAPEEEADVEIPVWIKTNAEFWINGDVSDDEFAIGLEWLINNGIIRIQDLKERMVAAYQIEGDYFPIYQFHVTPKSPDCPDYHLHASSGYAVEAVLVTFSDPNPGACGHGIIDSLVQHQITMTENQISKWEEVTENKIPVE